MSAETAKEIAEKDAELTVSRAPELGLKDLPKVPAYSGTGTDLLDRLDPLTVIDAWDLSFDLGTAVQSIADTVSSSYEDVSALNNAVFHLNREIARRSSRR